MKLSPYLWMIFLILHFWLKISCSFSFLLGWGRPECEDKNLEAASKVLPYPRASLIFQLSELMFCSSNSLNWYSSFSLPQIQMPWQHLCPWPIFLSLSQNIVSYSNYWPRILPVCVDRPTHIPSHHWSTVWISSSRAVAPSPDPPVSVFLRIIQDWILSRFLFFYQENVYSTSNLYTHFLWVCLTMCQKKEPVSSHLSLHTFISAIAIYWVLTMRQVPALLKL